MIKSIQKNSKKVFSTLDTLHMFILKYSFDSLMHMGDMNSSIVDHSNVITPSLLSLHWVLFCHLFFQIFNSLRPNIFLSV